MKKEALLHTLQVGDILPARVLRQISERQLVVELSGLELIAETNLKLNSPHIYVQVERILPKVHLRIIAGELNLNPELIDFLEVNGIILDDFTQWLLGELNIAEEKIGSRRDTLLKLRRFGEKFDVTRLIPFASYVDICKKDPDLFDFLNTLFAHQTEQTAGCFEEMNAMQQANLLEFYYKNYALQNLVDASRNMELSPLLLQTLQTIEANFAKFNRLNDGLFALDGFALPLRDGFRLIIIEKSHPPAAAANKIHRYQFSLPLPDFPDLKINLRHLKQDLSVTLISEISYPQSPVNFYEEAIKTYAQKYNFSLLPIKHEIVVKQSITGNYGKKA